MCQDHASTTPSRRLVLQGALGGAAAAALTGLRAGSARAQTAPGAPLGDGSGDLEDHPSRRPVPAGRTSSTAAVASPSAVSGTAAAANTTPYYASQNGWDVPTTNSSAAINIATYPLPGTGVSLSVKSGDVATVLVHVAQRFAATVQVLNANCGGYSWRGNVNSPGTWSNHASGTAIDLNWNLHPNGAIGTFTAAQVEQIRVILSECRGVVRWGGDYTSTRDEMHFEINVDPDDSRLGQLALDLRAQPRRLAVVRSDGGLWVKEGNLNAWWTRLPSPIEKVSVDCRRVVALTTDGTAVGCDSALGGDWVVLATGVADVAAGGGRVAVVGEDGSLRVKEGALFSMWTSLRTSGVTSVVLAGTRIGAVYKGSVQVKDGAVGAAWVTTNARGTTLALDSRRLVAVEDGTLLLKQGRLDGTWVTLARGESVSLSGERIAMVNEGDAWVKEGVNGLWVLLVKGGVSSVALQGDRIVVVQNGAVLVKEGSVSATWVAVTDAAVDVSVSG